VLSLNDNALTGPIPPSLGDLINLEQLDLANNRLGARIPWQLGQLTNLQFLILAENFLTRGIPPELGQLTNLQVLSLNNNRLDGHLPGTLSQLKTLTLLRLAGNNVTKVQHGTDKLGDYGKTTWGYEWANNEADRAQGRRIIKKLFKEISTKTYGLKAVLKADLQLPLEVIRDKVASHLFGKIIKPYKKHLSRVDDKGAYFNTRFGVQKLRDDERGLYLKNGKGAPLYLYKWH
jgi:Leucine-rich repeat (LRR) protein